MDSLYAHVMPFFAIVTFFLSTYRFQPELSFVEFFQVHPVVSSLVENHLFKSNRKHLQILVHVDQCLFELRGMEKEQVISQISSL